MLRIIKPLWSRCGQIGVAVYLRSMGRSLSLRHAVQLDRFRGISGGKKSNERIETCKGQHANSIIKADPYHQRGSPFKPKPREMFKSRRVSLPLSRCRMCKDDSS